MNELKSNPVLWPRLVSKVDGVIRKMPLWKLQMVGGHPLEVLYENRRKGNSIRLKPGVMFCFRRFHEFVTDFVRGAWVRYVRRFNESVPGESSDLDQFLFGSERASLKKYLPILRDVQQARCLYCKREVTGRSTTQIDHFIPWSLYPISATTWSSPTPSVIHRKLITLPHRSISIDGSNAIA